MSMTSELWRTTHVARLTGATYRQLDYWCSNGLIPGQPVTQGQGIPRYFTDLQVRHVRGLRALSNAGLIGDALRDASSRLADPDLDWGSSLALSYVPHVTIHLDLPCLR